MREKGTKIDLTTQEHINGFYFTDQGVVVRGCFLILSQCNDHCVPCTEL